MFVEKNNIDQMNSVQEADDNAAEVKPSCEVHGGNLFVQLHFKAIEKVPNTVELINTVVTSRDESSAKFAGCGKHLIAVRSTDEESPLIRTDAIKHIKAYFGTMFGQDVGNSLKDEDIHTIDEKGQEMNAEALKKWEEQQNKKSGDEEDKETIDESIPSFGRFILEDDTEDDDFNGDIEGEFGGDDDDAESAGDGGDNDDIEGEVGGDEDEGEEAGDEIPPPSTYIVCYGIKAEGQPDTDHTDSKTIEQLDPKGNLKMPGSNHEWGIKFSSTLGGGSDDLNLKKLGKEMAGKVDSDEIETQIRTIMRANFPDIGQPSIEIRDQKTIDVELKRRISEKEISEDEYDSKARALIANADYSVWIEVKDYREKPFIGKKDIADVINASVKKVGGRWAKLLSGVKEGGVIMLHGLSAMSKPQASKDEVYRSIPTPSEIEAFIEKGRLPIGKGQLSLAKIQAEIDNKFNACQKKNINVGEAAAMAAINKWKEFKKNNSSDSVTVSDYESFQSEYKKFYNKMVDPLLSEAFLSERELMQEIFGILYEDAGDEKPDADLESDGGDDGDAEETEEDDSDESSDNGSDGGEGDTASAAYKKKDQITNIFIVPMKGLDVDMDKSRFG